MLPSSSSCHRAAKDIDIDSSIDEDTNIKIDTTINYPDTGTATTTTTATATAAAARPRKITKIRAILYQSIPAGDAIIGVKGAILTSMRI